MELHVQRGIVAYFDCGIRDAIVDSHEFWLRSSPVPAEVIKFSIIFQSFFNYQAFL